MRNYSMFLIPLLLLAATINGQFYTRVTYETPNCTGDRVSVDYYELPTTCEVDSFRDAGYLLFCNQSFLYSNSYDNLACTGNYTIDIVYGVPHGCWINSNHDTWTLTSCELQAPNITQNTIKEVSYEDRECNKSTTGAVTYHYPGVCSIPEGGRYTYYECTSNYTMKKTVCADSDCELLCVTSNISLGCDGGNSYFTCISQEPASSTIGTTITATTSPGIDSLTTKLPADIILVSAMLLLVVA